MKAYILWNEDGHVKAIHQTEDGALQALRDFHENAKLTTERNHSDLFVEVDDYRYRIEETELKG